MKGWKGTGLPDGEIQGRGTGFRVPDGTAAQGGQLTRVWGQQKRNGEKRILGRQRPLFEKSAA